MMFREGNRNGGAVIAAIEHHYLDAPTIIEPALDRLGVELEGLFFHVT